MRKQCERDVNVNCPKCDGKNPPSLRVCCHCNGPLRSSADDDSQGGIVDLIPRRFAVDNEPDGTSAAYGNPLGAIAVMCAVVIMVVFTQFTDGCFGGDDESSPQLIDRMRD